MKILLTELGNAINAQGGTERVLANMANEMQRRGHKVYVMVFDRRAGELYFRLDEGVAFLNPGEGIRYNRGWVNIKNFFVKDRNQRQLNRFIHSAYVIKKKIRNLVDDINPDVVIGYEIMSAMVFADEDMKKYLYVQMFHFNPETVLMNPYLHGYYAKANCIQVLMPDDVSKTQNLLNIGNVVYVPNIVPQYDYDVDYSSKIVICVGRIDAAQKRQKILVEAFAKLVKKYPDWRLEFWGDIHFNEDYYHEIINFIEERQLKDRIRFMGSSVDIPKELAKASIFAFPSAYEGFPLALTEAMSVGLPVVACKEGKAVNQIVKGGVNGILCEEGVDAFANGLVKLMENEELRRKLGQQGKKDMEMYRPKKIWDKWEDLLVSMAGFGKYFADFKQSE